MSTHCGIAVKTKEGYETIYCHNDGSPDYMWPMLTKNYNSEELATKLINLGDASCICERLEPKITEKHSFDCREKDVCVFYGRDRGESDAEAYCYKTKRDLFKFYYVYLWQDGHWTFYKGGIRQPQYQ